jgi:hypothetical protein
MAILPNLLGMAPPLEKAITLTPPRVRVPSEKLRV